MKKVALITGSARRLGKEMALELASLDFDIVLHYNSSKLEEVKQTEDEVKSFGVECLTLKADISNVDEIKRLFLEIEKKCNRLDLLINNAAIFKRIDFFDIDESLFDNYINTNLKSVVFCSIEAAKLMLRNKEFPCNIINISSLGGIQNWERVIPYSLAKTGVIKFTKLSAKRLAPEILVNTIAPGTIWIENDENLLVNKEEEKLYPMKRFGNKNDINSIIRFLATNNKYITGNTFVVDGGRSL